ncbi:hypothetical protein CASFOL_033782 [Castilleja foliolosa]|uniref:RWP-RK domain-containing protein n=1 Tax=Castilleja foliolosa TaxID=1961234 RepID=A0ABD3BY01_9LAMI
MEMDPTASMFTFHDPFADEMLPLIDDEQRYLNILDPQPGPEELDDPLSDPFIWAFCNDEPENPTAGDDIGAISDDFNNYDITVYGDINPTPRSGFSVNPQLKYNCSCCQVLREITHTNGMNVKRLEIHGVFGVITHAVLGIYGFDPSSQGKPIQMFDFSNESTLMVKKFMVQYFEACKREGYDLMQDPLSKFYEALCVGLNEQLVNDPVDLQLSPEYTGDCPESQQEPMLQLEGGNNQGGYMKIPLAMQRERTRKLKLRDLKDYYDLPIEHAAKRMHICPTVMKKICRKNGVTRWPYRKVKSIQKKIFKKNKILNAGDDHERARALEDIQKHQQELATIYESFNQ